MDELSRRAFLSTAGAAGLAAASGSASAGAARRRDDHGPRFSMAFAPHFGMFRHHAGEDPVSQLEFAADVGFTAWEDNGMRGRTEEDQARIAKAMERLGIRMGVFVLNPGSAWQASFSRGRREDREQFVEDCRASVEVAKRVNATWATVVLGTREPRMDLEYQTAYAVDTLRRGAEVLEPHGLVMVLEPLNPHNHPNMLLAKMSHAYQICRAVDSPSCKILCDLYHQQITEGNLIPNVERSWDEIAYFQIGDNPGRKEPTTGEINYANVFGRIKQRGFEGILGMEHGISGEGKAGEVALIEAYRACDPS